MKITRKQLRRLIRESIEDSKVGTILKMLKNPETFETAMMLLDDLAGDDQADYSSYHEADPHGAFPIEDMYVQNVLADDDESELPPDDIEPEF